MPASDLKSLRRAGTEALLAAKEASHTALQDIGYYIGFVTQLALVVLRHCWLGKKSREGSTGMTVLLTVTSVEVLLTVISVAVHAH
eukprot:scaffold48144_cov20-Tisochrysis_lutea.AAC.1